MKIDLNDCFVTVESQLYRAGYTEDGDEYLAELFYVSIALPSGQRLRHHRSFYGSEVVRDDDGWGFVDVRTRAKDEAERLLCYLKHRRHLDTSHLDEQPCVYGSPYYQQWESKIVWEERERERRGF